MRIDFGGCLLAHESSRNLFKNWFKWTVLTIKCLTSVLKELLKYMHKGKTTCILNYNTVFILFFKHIFFRLFYFKINFITLRFLI